MDIELEYELICDKEYIYKAMWLEAFKFSKEISEIYGGLHWRSKKAIENLNEVQKLLEQINLKRKEVQAKYENKH